MNIQTVFGPLLGAYGIVLAVLSFVVPLILAIAVMFDRPPRRVLVGRWVWALAVFLGGVFAAGLYWVLHHGLIWKNSEATPL